MHSKAANRINFFLKDYRELTNRYDRIVSVGMLEHVGRQQFDQFFSCVDQYLCPDGVAIIHAIGRFGKAQPTSPWIDKYIFPGGYLPNLEQITRSVEKTSLKITDIEITQRRWRRGETRLRQINHSSLKFTMNVLSGCGGFTFSRVKTISPIAVAWYFRFN